MLHLQSPRPTTLLLCLALAFVGSTAFAQNNTDPKKKKIITDDIMMMHGALPDGMDLTCDGLGGKTRLVVEANDSKFVGWEKSKAVGDSMRLMLVEIFRRGASVAKFTLAYKTDPDQPSIQCMKGFGCDEKRWVAFDWKSPDGNYLEHSTHKFRVGPTGKEGIVIENLHPQQAIIIKVNMVGGD